MIITQENLVNLTAAKEDIDAAVVRKIFKSEENIIFDCLSSTNPVENTIVKILDGLSLECKYIPNWGVKKAGHSLVGELGQELWVHSKDGTFETVGDNGAEFIDIKPNDIIFNHLQTKQLLDKGNIIGRGRSYANGTALVNGRNDEGWITLSDGLLARPLQEGDKGWDLMQKFQPLADRILSGEKELVTNAMSENQQQLEKWTKEITNNIAVNNITNNRNMPPIVNQEFHITLPNVTNSTSAEALMNDLQSLATKKFQMNW